MSTVASRRLGLAVGAALVAFAAGGAPAGEPPTSTPTLGIHDRTVTWTAFTHATVVVSPDKTLEDATLVVKDGRVAAVGVGMPVPSGALEVDLTGKRVLPGFLDLASEYGLLKAEPREREGGRRGRGRNAPPQYQGERQGANAWNDAIHAERDWVEEFKPDGKEAERLAKLGFTAVSSARMDGIFRGRGFVASLGEGLPNDLLLLPHGSQYLSFDKGSSQQAYPSSLMGSIALLRQTFLDARWYAQAQEAYRRNPRQPVPEANLALAALAAYRGPYFFETGDDLSLLRAARVAREAEVPVVLLGSNLEHTRVEEVAALGMPVVLPLSFPKAPDVSSFEDGLDVPLVDLRHWERAPSTAALLDKAGVRLAFTARGARPEEDFWENLRRTVTRGLSEAKALAALTTVPAELAGVARDLGTLEAGKRADFVVLDGNPFTAKAEVLSVFIAGRPRLSPEALERHDFRGGYRFALDGVSYEVSVGGKPRRLRGKIFQGKQETELEHLEAAGRRLDFTAVLASGSAPARFRLEEVAGTVAGRVSRAGAAPEAFAVETLAKARPLGEGPGGGRGRGGPGSRGEGSGGDGGGDGWGDGDRFAKLDRAPLVSRRTYPNAAFGFTERPRPTDVLVRNATVWTNGPDGVLEGADLLVKDGKIAAVGRGLTAGGGVEVIDGTGKHVTAGAIDEHSHLAVSAGVNEGSHAITAEVRIGDVLDPDDPGIYRALAGGTTAMQLLHGSANPIGGQAQVVKLRWGAGPEEMKLAEAPPSIKFALGENVKQSNWGPEAVTRYPQTRMGVETLMKDAFLAARLNHEAWQRYRALPETLRGATVPPRRDLVLEALWEILDHRRFVHCHSYVQSEILSTIRLAEELGFTLQTFTHILEGYKVAPEMARHGSGGSSFSDWWGYKFEVYDAIPYNTCLMHQAGVVTSINSDSPDLVRRLFHEAAKSVFYCGMEPAEALKLATLNPAKQLKIDQRVGSLEAGKDADFVIWNGPPMSIYSRVQQTWVDGTRMFDLERDRQLAQADAAERGALIAKAIEASEGDFGGDDYSRKRRQQVWHCEDVDDVWDEVGEVQDEH